MFPSLNIHLFVRKSLKCTAYLLMLKHYAKKLTQLTPINPFVDIYVFHYRYFGWGFSEIRKKKNPDLHFPLPMFKTLRVVFIVLAEK